MLLNVQLYSLVVSFLFGVLLSLEFLFFSKIVSNMRLIFRGLLSFVFVMMNAVVYFWILILVNNGILHIYFFISIIVGYLLFNKLFTRLFTHFRKKS